MAVCLLPLETQYWWCWLCRLLRPGFLQYSSFVQMDFDISERLGFDPAVQLFGSHPPGSAKRMEELEQFPPAQAEGKHPGQVTSPPCNYNSHARRERTYSGMWTQQWDRSSSGYKIHETDNKTARAMQILVVLKASLSTCTCFWEEWTANTRHRHFLKGWHVHSSSRFIVESWLYLTVPAWKVIGLLHLSSTWGNMWRHCRSSSETFPHRICQSKSSSDMSGHLGDVV